MPTKNYLKLLGFLSVVTIAALAGACGQVGANVNYDGTVNGDGTIVDGDGTVIWPDAGPDYTGTISGTVWVPGNGPGLVPPGHEMPVNAALIYISSTKPPPIPQEVYCEQCIDPPMRYTTSDHKGQFTLTGVFAGDYWLVIQKGQFRKMLQISIGQEEDLVMQGDDTTLPSAQDYDNGWEIPKIALASGVYDQMEDILGKMGIGQVDGAGRFVGTSAAGVFDVYSNGGNIDSNAIGTLQSLLENYTAMSQYHIIFIPCSYQTYSGGSGLSSAPVTVLQNLRQFVSDGGKLYVTDWSGEYVDNVFPEQIRFASDHDTPPAAWSGTAWNTSLFSDADGSPSYQSDNALAEDPDLYTWIHGQQGPTVHDTIETYNGSDFEVEGNWDHIDDVVDVQLGLDGEGFPILDRPHVYIIGDQYGTPSTCVGATGCTPLTVTFEPVGCGRVLYSTYHTTEGEHLGLVPQERVLVYLIMEIGVCKSGPIVR